MNLIGNINAIPFRRFRGGGGVSPIPPFPSIPGMIARYSASGLTNEQMKENPVWVDKTGNGHDLQMKNFLWGGMSGVGGYEMNFNLWTNNAPSISDISMSTTTTSVSVSVGNSTYNNNLIYIHKNNWDINKNHWLKVTSTYEDGDLVFKFYNDNNSKNIELPANGYVNIPAYPEFKGNFMYISTTSNKQGSFTIEQLPLYPGALVFDGVDDYGVCDNFPILTKEKGYTVVALRQWISMGEGLYGLVSNVKNWFNDGAFVLEYNSNNATNKFVNRPVSFGKVNIEMDLPNNFTYQTSKSYKGVPITTGSFKGTNSLFVGKLALTNVGTCINAAIWELVFLDHDATEEELTKIKDYFVKTYPWLFPDQAWTVTGKTNEDEDRATIANITGNGNDLVLSNFGFVEGSGYGLYANDFTIFSTNPNTIPVDKTNSKISVNTTINSSTWVAYINNVEINPMRVEIKGKNDKDEMVYRHYSLKENKINEIALSNGIHSLPKSEINPAEGTNWCGFLIRRSTSSNITIEQIPEYEGYLITDGVDDEIISAKPIQFADKFTIVGDWKFMEDRNDNAGLLKANQIYIYNATTGMRIYLKQGSKNYPFSCKKINALTSDGWVYDEKWDKYKVYPIGSNIDISIRLFLGFYSSNFTKIALKNLGIYNDQLLSKDDCIKAYNYLQTLKAK